MKRCPQCNRVENDDTLAFCRADGTPLVTDSLSVQSDAAQTLASTKAASEIETSLLPDITGDSLKAAPTPFGQSSAEPTRKLVNRQRKVVVVPIVLIVAAFALLVFVYRARNNNTTIDSIAVLPFVNSTSDPNTD